MKGPIDISGPQNGPKAERWAMGVCEDGHVVVGLFDEQGTLMAEGHMTVEAAREFMGHLVQVLRAAEAQQYQQVGHA